ncbi:hypothetical protein EBZ39_00945 [bacterium]|nr:hypothetical protein [bacterium]
MNNRYEYWKQYYQNLDKKRVFNRMLDRIWRRVYLPIFLFWCSLIMVAGYMQFMHDYHIVNNYAHIEIFDSEFYTSWRTDGKAGQEPPIN